MALSIILLALSFNYSNQLWLNATTINSDDKDDNTEELDSLFNIVMGEISKIQKNETTDNGYIRMIFIILILFFIFSIKTKIYKIFTCCKRLKPTPNDTALEKITIQELNYIIN
ncbi:ORF-125 [Buzura suppressaria nucleopolyhedrovirus]|uniref:ORF-125 n=1 Tax=Buzura suppressaria nuclear polyhedrosis virus TaxID=74320 RepID=W5VLE9_NPVBS|nr:ORF-125 [Buzura suppressaria nucleopolyhedrovirus]AHH82714.1 ORF-125 [Buzura suppressaria nucleopolyhedrovirus]AKN91098.1 ORF-128 [Buzura suppressaria nucleopolyhedrovirus]